MTDDKKIFLVKTKSLKFENWLSYHKFTDGDIDFVELNRALEEKIISEMPLGNDEGLKQLVRDVFQKLKESVSSEGLSKEKEVL